MSAADELARWIKRGSPQSRKLAAVIKRDGPGCWYCGEDRPLTVDHVKARCRGGSNTLKNLRAACRECNESKGQMTEAEFRKVMLKRVGRPSVDRRLRP